GSSPDGLWDSVSNSHMVNLAEYTAKKAGVSREEQDRFALASHQKAVAAMDACRFKAETVSVELPGKKGPTLIEKDEGPRKDSSLETLAALKPSFEKDGTVRSEERRVGKEWRARYAAGRVTADHRGSD